MLWANALSGQVFIEDHLEEGAEVNFAAFERFLIKFLQHQFCRCVETYASNRGLFLRLGGRDLQGLALSVYRDRAEAKKEQLGASSLALFGEGLSAVVSDLAELTANSLTSVASMFSPW